MVADEIRGERAAGTGGLGTPGRLVFVNDHQTGPTSVGPTSNTSIACLPAINKLVPAKRSKEILAGPPPPQPSFQVNTHVITPPTHPVEQA